MVLFEPVVLNLILSKQEVKNAQQPCCVTQDEEAETRHSILRTSEGPTESLKRCSHQFPDQKNGELRQDTEYQYRPRRTNDSEMGWSNVQL